MYKFLKQHMPEMHLVSLFIRMERFNLFLTNFGFVKPKNYQNNYNEVLYTKFLSSKYGRINMKYLTFQCALQFLQTWDPLQCQGFHFHL